MYLPTESDKQKTLEKNNLFSAGILKATDEKSKIRNPVYGCHGSVSVSKCHGFATLVPGVMIIAVLRIRDVCPGSRIQMFSIPDPGSASNNLSILTQKIRFLALGNMIRVVHPGSGSRILFFPILDPGSRGQKGTGSWIRKTCNRRFELIIGMSGCVPWPSMEAPPAPPPLASPFLAILSSWCASSTLTSSSVTNRPHYRKPQGF